MALLDFLFSIQQRCISKCVGRKGSWTGDEHNSCSETEQGPNKWTHHHHCRSLAPLTCREGEEPPWAFLAATTPACNSPTCDPKPKAVTGAGAVEGRKLLGGDSSLACLGAAGAAQPLARGISCQEALCGAVSVGYGRRLSISPMRKG